MNSTSLKLSDDFYFKTCQSMKKVVLLLVLISIVLPGLSQNEKIYVVRNGKLSVTTYYKDSLLRVRSNELKVTLDYETGDIAITLNPKSLRTGLDSLDIQLTETSFRDIIFLGNIGITNLNLSNDPEQEITVIGNLTLNDITLPVIFQGKLKEWREGPGIGGILYLHSDFPISGFNLMNSHEGFSEYICVEIFDALLLDNGSR